MMNGVKALLSIFLFLCICIPVEGGAGYTVVVSRRPMRWRTGSRW